MSVRFGILYNLFNTYFYINYCTYIVILFDGLPKRTIKPKIP